MSWSALAWATDSDVGSSAAKFIRILLANKADENYSCYPSIRTLMAESNAGRSTVLRALKDLETRGFISRRPQFHDSGARRSTRYYLNHPLAPHLSPSPDPGPPRPDLGPPGPDPRRAPSRCDTGRVSKRHPTGVSQWDPLNPSAESPSEPSGTTAGILAAVTEAWKLSTSEARSLLSGIESALAHGWPGAELTEHLVQNTSGAREPVRGYWPVGWPIFPGYATQVRRSCHGAVNARTRSLALSLSQSPTEPKSPSSVHSAALKSTGPVHPGAHGKMVNYLGEQRVQ